METVASREAKGGPRRTGGNHEQQFQAALEKRGFLLIWVVRGTHLWASVWHFIVVNVQAWWHRGAMGDIIGGIAGLVVFLWLSENSRRAKSDARSQGKAFVTRE